MAGMTQKAVHRNQANGSLNRGKRMRPTEYLLPAPQNIMHQITELAKYQKLWKLMSHEHLTTKYLIRANNTNRIAMVYFADSNLVQSVTLLPVSADVILNRPLRWTTFPSCDSSCVIAEISNINIYIHIFQIIE